MNWNKTTAISTLILAVIGFGVAIYNIREADIARMDKHIAAEGHPRLVEQVKYTRELLEQRVANMERMLKDTMIELKELRADMKDIRACMHRIEARQKD